MATHIDYDLEARIIYVTTAPVAGRVTLNVQKDVFSAAKLDWKNLADSNQLIMPFKPNGGFIITPGKTLTPYYQLRTPWTMRPYEADHTLYLEKGVLIDEAGGDPWIPTLGTYTVNVRDAIPSDARTNEVGTSGLTPEESTKLTRIDTSVAYQIKIIDNRRILIKEGLTWYSRVFDDNDSTVIQNKALKDPLGNDIDDLTAGILAQELKSIVA